MANLNRFLTYYIVLTDPALVAQYQAQFPYGYQFAPYNPMDASTHQPGGAAIAFAAPWTGGSPGAAAPYTWTPEAGNYDNTVATFERTSGGFWGMGGTTVRYYWVGQFKLAEPAVPTVSHVVPPSPGVPPIRRFIEGFEFGNCGIDTQVAGGGQFLSRDASRHVGGMGLAMRGPNNTSGGIINQDAYGAALKNRTWVRFYIRLRKPDPIQTVPFWGTHGGTSSGNGVHLGITPDARLALFSSDVGSTRTLLATSGTVLPIWNGSSVDDGWQKIDILLRYNPNEVGPPIINTGRCQVFINGASSINVTGLTGSGLGSNETHKSSHMGTPLAAGTSLYLDVDDWTESDWPGPAETAGGPKLDGPDWLSGTKIVAARPKAFGAGHNAAAWPGDFRTLAQNPLSIANSFATLISNTNAGVCEVDLDVDLCVTKDTGRLGVASFMVQTFTAETGGTQGTLGYLLNGGGAVMAGVAEGGVIAGFAQRKSLADGATPGLQQITTLSIRKVKSADLNTGTLSMLGAQIEMIGMWGKADFRTTEQGTTAPTFPRFVGQHNAPYPRSIYANDTAAPPPNSPVIVVAGTYVGNGTGQDITFRTPPCFLCVRPLAADTGGFKWWSSMLGAHRSAQQTMAGWIARFDQDVSFVPGVGVDVQQERYRMRIAGADTQINAIGVTYQYVAFCDPGARFTLAGEMAHLATQAAFDNNLINPNFTPEAGLFFGEDTGGVTTTALYFKGLGVPADTVFRWTTTAQLAAALTFGLGKLTTQPAFHALAGVSASCPFLLFRRADGSGDPGQPGVMALANWTGDGSASRSVSLAPASGKRPIFVMVFASDAGGAFFRDPSHTTTNSSRDNGATSATGITGAGIDSFSVGVTLNTNAVNYSAIVFFGDATAGNGGFGVNAEYIPVEAGPPQDGPFPTPTLANFTPAPTPVVPIVGEPDLDAITVISDAATSIGGLVGGQTCEYYTRHVVNMALSRVGISARIANVATEMTQAAITARSHILEDTNQVLRDFDWPFATRYANLVLVAGTATVPAESDWQYSYRAPNAMMKARRLVNQAGNRRTYDPNPPKFRIGSDSIGPLIYTNELATTAMPLALEYTIRQLCPALYGDSLFRDALAWKFAFSMAPVLSKDTKKQEYCRQMYERAIAHAKVPAAQEQQQPPGGDADWINDREFGPLGARAGWPWDR